MRTAKRSERLTQHDCAVSHRLLNLAIRLREEQEDVHDLGLRTLREIVVVDGDVK